MTYIQLVPAEDGDYLQQQGIAFEGGPRFCELELPSKDIVGWHWLASDGMLAGCPEELIADPPKRSALPVSEITQIITRTGFRDFFPGAHVGRMKLRQTGSRKRSGIGYLQPYFGYHVVCERALTAIMESGSRIWVHSRIPSLSTAFVDPVMPRHLLIGDSGEYLAFADNGVRVILFRKLIDWGLNNNMGLLGLPGSLVCLMHTDFAKILLRFCPECGSKYAVEDLKAIEARYIKRAGYVHREQVLLKDAF